MCVLACVYVCVYVYVGVCMSGCSCACLLVCVYVSHHNILGEVLQPAIDRIKKTPMYMDVYARCVCMYVCMHVERGREERMYVCVF